MNRNISEVTKKSFLVGFIQLIALNIQPIIADSVTYTITLTGNNGTDDITGEFIGDLTQRSNNGLLFLYEHLVEKIITQFCISGHIHLQK